jgi:PAS domain S-box-containing protein
VDSRASYAIGVLVFIVAIQTAAIVALLIRDRQHMRADRTLRESEKRFRRILDEAPVMIWTARPDTTLDYLNSTCVEFTGLPLEKLLNEGWLDVVHPEDLDRCVGTYTPAIEARVPFLVEYRARRADGAYRWLLATGVPKYGPDGGFAGYIGCDFDITERRNAEDLIHEHKAALESNHREIEHLAGRLIEAQDAERARIARDLHDDVSQQLAGLFIAFSGLEHRMHDLDINEELRADLRQLRDRTTILAQCVRDLSHDLHPTVLQHAGLVAALTSHCAEVERLHGTASSCSAEGDFGSLAPEARLCLYRIAQEALRNVIAHAGASRVDVRLIHTGDHAELTVADDGSGFDVARPRNGRGGLGLVSIAERVRLAGGTLSIRAEVGKGTCVRVRIPANGLVRSDWRAGA